MTVLLDTNIIIHREASRVINPDIGILFQWLDRINYKKCIHPLTINEIKTNLDQRTVETMAIKLNSYYILQTLAPRGSIIADLSARFDKSENDVNDTSLLNEVFSDRVDFLITEDKKIHLKARDLGIADRVFKISSFLEKCIAENPEIIDYSVLAVRKQHFGNINIQDPFFESFRTDYKEFDKWFNKNAEKLAYVCYYDNMIGGFLYIKAESEQENYNDIQPTFTPKRRLKIGTFKVTLNGLKIGERFLKIVFDNALHFGVQEIYVTIFDKTPEQIRLINLLEEFGFIRFGIKTTANGEELVYVRDFSGKLDNTPKISCPFISLDKNIFFVSIWPEYHTELFPDSILKTEIADEFIDNQPHRNAISKVYISHSLNRDVQAGDTIIFYRTGGVYKGVVTTLCIVESVIVDVHDEQHLIEICKRKTVLSDDKLKEYWRKFPKLRPFVINILYSYSLKKKLNLKTLIELGIIKSAQEMPRGLHKLEREHFIKILNYSKSNERIIGY